MSELHNWNDPHLPPVATRARLAMQFRAFSRGGDVMRFHTRPQLHPQSVAAHSYGVAWLCNLLTGGQPTAELLLSALMHDVPEFVTGDVPGHTKAAMNSDGLARLEAEVLERAHLLEPALTDDEERILKLADLLEGMRHCCRERQLGNQLIAACYKRYAMKSAELCQRPHETYLLNFINQQWREAHGTEA